MKQEDKQKLMNRLVNLGITALDAVACSYDSFVRQQADMHAMNIISMLTQLDAVKNDDEEEKRTRMLSKACDRVTESWDKTFKGFPTDKNEAIDEKHACACVAERITEER